MRLLIGLAALLAIAVVALGAVAARRMPHHPDRDRQPAA
ncbi:hypothetical protein ATKI12_5735 [Kitasatospora sp. Ki12]